MVVRPILIRQKTLVLFLILTQVVFGNPEKICSQKGIGYFKYLLKIVFKK